MQPSPQQARPARRILALALPHLAAEAALRREGLRGIQAPFAVVEKQGSALRLASVTAAALAAGLAPGQGLADARAICPGLLTRPAMPERHTALLRALARWAERFSPLVGLDMADTLILDITGVGHLFGSEAELAAKAVAECAALSLTARAGLAETRGAAWALAHYGAFAAPSNPSTLSTPSTQPARGAGAKRRSAPARQSGGDQPLPAATLPNGFADAVAIVPPRRLRAMLAPLPVAALRLDEAAVEGLMALGLGTLGEMAGVPRGQIARRFGVAVLRRLDQALGVEPEPVSPLRARPVFSARLTLPEPIGLTSDVMAGLERLLE
ncbi:MAG: DNA polymerase Y family protein, partial [Pseudomonadota bacterium]